MRESLIASLHSPLRLLSDEVAASGGELNPAELLEAVSS